MNTHADKTQENKSQSVANEVSQMQSVGESTFQFVDNRPEAIAQRKLQEMANNSPRVLQLRSFQEMANNSPQAKQATQLQAMLDNYSAQQQQSIQKKENNTGLPDNLKSGIENLSGYSMDDVNVHYNSDKPAQLQAHAYAQGTDIHLASGQQKHLPHEAWHVVQQKQGRVKPTLQMKGKANINDDIGLEKEADVIGAKALESNTQLKRIEEISSTTIPIIQRQLQAVPPQNYLVDNRDNTNQQFTPIGVFAGLTGPYTDNAYNYYYDDATRQYEVGNQGSNVFWDVEYKSEYNKRTNVGQGLVCYEVDNQFNNRYYYRNFHYHAMPNRAKWVDSHDRFVEEVRPQHGVPYFRVLTNDGQRVQKHYVIGKDQNDKYVMPVKNANGFMARLPQVFGGNLDPTDANPEAAMSRETDEESEYSHEVVANSTAPINFVNQGGNRLHFHRGEIREIPAHTAGAMRLANPIAHPEMNGDFKFHSSEININALTTDLQIKKQILHLFAVNKGIMNLGNHMYAQAIQEFQTSHAITAMVAEIRRDKPLYETGLTDAQANNVAANPGESAYMAGYDQYNQGLAHIRGGVAVANNLPAYMAARNEYNQGLVDIQGGVAAAIAHPAYMAARNDYTASLNNIQQICLTAAHLGSAHVNATLLITPILNPVNPAMTNAHNQYVLGWQNAHNNIAPAHADHAYMEGYQDYI